MQRNVLAVDFVETPGSDGFSAQLDPFASRLFHHSYVVVTGKNGAGAVVAFTSGTEDKGSCEHDHDQAENQVLFHDAYLFLLPR